MDKTGRRNLAILMGSHSANTLFCVILHDFDGAFHGSASDVEFFSGLSNRTAKILDVLN